MADRIKHRSTQALPDGRIVRRTSDELVPSSIASLDETLPPTSLLKLLEVGSASVYVLSKDPELVAAFTVAGGDRVPVHVIWSFRELRRQVEHRECTIILLDADLFEGSLRGWIEDLCALEPTLVILVAAQRPAAEKAMELLSERLVHRLLIKPATVGIASTTLEAAVSRYVQLREEVAASRHEVAAARDDVAAAANEIPAPRNELLAMRAAEARSEPIRAPRRRPVARSKTYWPAWILPIGLVVALAVAVFIGDFAPLERTGTGGNAGAPAEPGFAEPAEAEAPPDSQVAGRTEEAFLPDSPRTAEPAGGAASTDADLGETAAEVAPEADEAPRDTPLEPPATAAPDSELASEPPAVGGESPLAELGAEPPVDSPPVVGPPSPAVGPPSPAAVPAATTPPELAGLLAAAWSRVQQNRLLEPPGDSARDYVARAAELAPSHPDVAAIRLVLAEAVAESARAALESGDLESAETLADEAFRLGASAETLAVLDLDLGAAREVAGRRAHSELLSLGVARIREDRLIAPQNDNALDYLGRLRAENPSYPGLDSAWQSLGDAIAIKVEESAAAEDWAGAEAWLEPLALVASPATVERSTAELAAKRLEAEYRTTPAAQGELRLLATVEPVYPEEARRRGVAGWVDVEFIVGTDGIPREARVVAADPPTTFDQAALAAVSLYRYEPFERENRAYERLARLRIRFDLR